MTHHLVCHYLAWMLVGHWAVAGVVLSSPCYKGTFVYPLMANVAVVMLIGTTFVCRRTLSCIPELPAALVTLARCHASKHPRTPTTIAPRGPSPDDGAVDQERQHLLPSAIPELWIPRQARLKRRSWVHMYMCRAVARPGVPFPVLNPPPPPLPPRGGTCVDGIPLSLFSLADGPPGVQPGLSLCKR
jgi:hypothetical protein